MSNNKIEFSVDKNNLYREENILDPKAALIRCLTPINMDGSIDESRAKVYMGHTQIMSPQGPLPLSAPLKASTLAEAIDNFPEAMQIAMEEMIENVKKMHQEMSKSNQEESPIIMPGS